MMEQGADRTAPPATDVDVFSQGTLVGLLDDILASALSSRTTGKVIADFGGEVMARRFDWAVDRLTYVNQAAAALVTQNTESLALMQSLGDRIDRANAENQRIVDEIVNGATAA